MNKLLPKIIWVLVAVVLLVGLVRVLTSRSDRSADQQILINKSK